MSWSLLCSFFFNFISYFFVSPKLPYSSIFIISLLMVIDDIYPIKLFNISIFETEEKGKKIFLVNIGLLIL